MVSFFQALVLTTSVSVPHNLHHWKQAFINVVFRQSNVNPMGSPVGETIGSALVVAPGMMVCIADLSFSLVKNYIHLWRIDTALSEVGSKSKLFHTACILSSGMECVACRIAYEYYSPSTRVLGVYTMNTVVLIYIFTKRMIASHWSTTVLVPFLYAYE